MKVILLAGGFGTRLADHTALVPKPMVLIGDKPILWHIMRTYAYFGHKDFFVALGYKATVIKEYFLNYRPLHSDFTIDLATGVVKAHQVSPIDWRVTLVSTGDSSMTGGRVKRLQPYIGNEPFMLTYGDGVSDIDLDALLAFHRSHGKMVTVCAVRPTARFGELKLNGVYVEAFKEKPQMHDGWINGGYFVIEPAFFDLITDDQTILEHDPLEKVSQAGELVAYRHEGFWQCMDTKRDLDYLQSLWSSNTAPWRK